jgi:phage protein D
VSLALPSQQFLTAGLDAAAVTLPNVALMMGSGGMGTARRVKAIVTVNGRPVAGAFWEHLISLTVTDNEGTKSDTVDLELEDGPPHLTIPQDEDEVRVWLGYDDGAMDYLGLYLVNDVDVDCLPWKMKVKGNAADMAKPLKEHKLRHWDDTTLGDVVKKVGADAGLSVQIAPKLASEKLDYWLQQNESGLHMLERLAERFGATFKVADGKLLFLDKGAGETASGQALPQLVLGPGQIIKGSCTVSFGKREKHKKVSAEYYDPNDAEAKRVTADGEQDSKARFTMRHRFGSKGQAKAAARAKRKYLKREGVRTSVRIEGNPFVRAGMTMTYSGVRPGVDGLPFTIETVSHTYGKSGGYVTQIQAKLKPSGGKGGGVSDGGTSASTAEPDAYDDPIDKHNAGITSGAI